MIKRLAHINLISGDLARSEHFYCHVLGLKKVFSFYKDGELFGFYLALGDMTFIEIFIDHSPSSQTNPIIRHLCLETDNIDAMIADVRGKGWHITDKKLGADQAWQAWITDPDGVTIEVMQYTPESSQYTGADCTVDW